VCMSCCVYVCVVARAGMNTDTPDVIIFFWKSTQKLEIS